MLRKMLLGAALVLGGCTTIPLTSIPRLMKINFLTTDIAYFRVAITVPDSFGLLKPPAFFKYDYQLPDEEAHHNAIPLEETTDAADLAGIPQDAPEGTHIHVFRMPASSAEQLNKLRSEETARAKTKSKRGSFQVGAAGNFCKKSEPPAGPILVTTYVRTSETEVWTTFSSKLDIRAQKQGEEILAKLETCK